MDTMTAEPMSQAKVLRSLYGIMTGIENNLGGGEGVEGLYGSITATHMQRLLTVMRERCGLGPDSHLVDVGAGLGRPLLHALVTEGLRAVSGVELDAIKCMKAEAFLRQAAAAAARRGLAPPALPVPAIRCAPVEAVATLDPATHAYSFWEGVPGDARAAFGRLFARSRTLQAVTVVQRSLRDGDPGSYMEEVYGFGPLRLVDNFAVNMSGSGRQFQAYVFVRDGAGPAGARSPRRRAAAAAADGARVPTPPRSADPLAPCSAEGSAEAAAATPRAELVASRREEPEVVSSRKLGRRRHAVLAGALFEEEEEEEEEARAVARAVSGRGRKGTVAAAAANECWTPRRAGAARGGQKRTAAPRAPALPKAAPAEAPAAPSPKKRVRVAALAPASPPRVTRSVQAVLEEPLRELPLSPTKRSPVKRAPAAERQAPAVGPKGDKLRQRKLLAEPGALPPRRRGRAPEAPPPPPLLRSSPRKAAAAAVPLDEIPPTVACTPLPSPRKTARSPAGSPAKSPGRREARGLLDCALVGRRWVLDAGEVAECLRDSAYPRTRHALREVALA